ncbi:hypothetical protein [Methylocystis sp.]|uniref:hypothetical protein n=1 Tax=Methylocystis sp. TaxID=1911079 RepID=UPI0025DDFAA8|nr:hypothetical protein [Methylocystis sp.]
MSKQQLIPPMRVLPSEQHAETMATIVPVRSQPGGLIDGYFNRVEARSHTKTFSALTARTSAEAELFDAQKGLIEAYGRRQRALAELHELPEILASERATRRAERADQLRQAQHRYEVAEVKRLTELAHVETTLVDAQQALRAQREYGYTTYELAWKKKYLELLDVELGHAERLAILRQHDKSLAKALSARRSQTINASISDDAVDDTLHTQRSELAASGLDTSRIDSLIERRKARG